MAASAENAVMRDEPSQRSPQECPVEYWLAFLGHRWTGLALWHLSDGPRRFGDLMASLPGITPKVLTDRLDNLVDHGLVCRTSLQAYPRGSLYALTASGSALIPVLDQLEAWSKRGHDGKAGADSASRSAMPSG